MSQFNKKASSTTYTGTKEVENFSGGIGYSRNKDLTSQKQEMASIILNSMLSGDNYYQSQEDLIKSIEKMYENPNMHEFLAKCMIYVRSEGYLRSVSHFMAVLLSENAKGTEYLRPALFKTMIRADDLTNMVAIWNSRNPKSMIPNALRRALKDKMELLSDYELRKYEGKRLQVKLRDVAKLARPNPEKSKGNIKGLIEGKLPNITTVQTINASSTGEDRADNYKEALKERKLGLMGAMKNIKNILESGADEETINYLCSLLENERAILNSKILPFRYIDAYEIINSLNFDRFLIKRIVNSLEKGFSLSTKNLEFVQEGEKVAILLDESGSMSGVPFKHGRVITSALLNGLDENNTIAYLWANQAREVSVKGTPFEMIEKLKCGGGGTDLGSPFQKLFISKTFVDKIIILTDMQQNEIGGVNDIYNQYRKINPNVKILFWNLSPYGGATPLKLNKDVLEVAGFSDKILSLIPKFWKDKNALVQEIENIKII